MIIPIIEDCLVEDPTEQFHIHLSRMGDFSQFVDLSSALGTVVIVDRNSECDHLD